MHNRCHTLIPPFALNMLCGFYCLLMAGAALSHDAPPPENATHIKLWAGGHAPSRLQYELALLTAILDTTVEDYGPYHIDISREPLPVNRGRKMLAQGDFHLIPAQDWVNKAEQEQFYYRIPYPIWRGLLGYRQLMVREDHLDAFAAVTRPEDLQKFTAGQGERWADSEYYLRNNIDVVTSMQFDNLFSMLNRGRFDFLPLGINEMQGSLAIANEQHPALTVVPHLIIHYPMPIYFQVNRRYMALAERIETGLTRAEKAGTLDRVFREYNGPMVDYIDAPETRIIHLN